MKILVTGDRGYIGPVLVQLLLEKSYEVLGYDTDYYSDCEIYDSGSVYPQITKDIRHIELEDLNGVDAVVHLAGLSNDPLGEFAPAYTEEINLNGTLKLAALAKKAGIERFIYASSQSMYGISDTSQELDEDNSQKNPITVYAKTKWEAECRLKELGDKHFTPVCFRPSTVFGASPRLRCDIVFNNLVACAYTTGKIEIKSDGSPFRPVIHVRDVCNAFIAGLEAPKDLVVNQSFNVGIKNGNYTVKELAETAQKVVPGSRLTFTGEHGPDSRTYKVNFNKILTVLKDYYKPEWDLIRGGEELINCFEKIGLTEDQFRGRSCNRLDQLKYLMQYNQIDKLLFHNKNEQ